MARTRAEGELLLGEWACLGLIAASPSVHGFAIAQQLGPSGALGRVWTMRRPLVYRAIDTLLEAGYIRPSKTEPGIAGGDRTLYRVTAAGKRELLRWLAEPVRHLRDVRSELLLKMLLCEEHGIDTTPLLKAQREWFAPMVPTRRPNRHDTVALWRYHAARSVVDFLDECLVNR